ncbi:MAG: transglutaminase family protein [Balneolaceae bacterium]|nr:MAG: transglutaminase family protein [Balneolaceae bacterium]
MIFKIWHHTRYLYSHKVFLEPHYLRFKPLQKSYLTLNHFHLKMDPEPVGLSFASDAENNPITQIWFNDQIDSLDIDVQIEVSVTEDYDFFSFILDPYCKLGTREPVYSQTLSDFFKPYLKGEVSGKIKSYVDTIIRKNDGEIIPTLFSLTDHIYREWEHHLVIETSELDSENCFREKAGSCRDLSWMLIEMLRYTGLAARYVSGYTYNDELDDGHELHAWVEVYLPGAGWIGIDPSAGIFVHEKYIPVSASFNPANTMPVTGNFRGNANSKMETHVSIEQIDD